MICAPKCDEVVNSLVTEKFKQRLGAPSSARFTTAFPYGRMSLHLSSQRGSSCSPPSEGFHGDGHVRIWALSLVKQGSGEEWG